MERNQQSVNTYNTSAKSYEDKFMKMDLYNNTYDAFCDLISDKNAEVLELAVGPGNVTKYLLNKRPDFNILGIDLAPNMVALAKKNNPTAHFEIMDCREISTIKKQFNVIMCGFCMPYLSKEECSQIITDTSNLLTTSGVLYISTMEGDYEKSGYETTSFSGENKVFIYYHQEDFLKDCLIKNGFEIVSLERKDYPEPDGTFLTDMIFIARKNRNDN